MEALDLQTMADAALKCHSYARAFQYQEKWVESKTSPPGASDITRYQNIVAKLREFSFLDIVSDWVSGYDLQLNALTFKFQGQWIDSMNCYYALVGENSGGKSCISYFSCFHLFLLVSNGSGFVDYWNTSKFQI